MTEANPLTKLREPFPASQVGKLPRIICPNCQKAPAKVCQEHSKAKCSECDNYITGRHIHLDYVGHGAVTDRLLEVDPAWNWEPLGLDPNGMPAFEQTPKGDRVGLWIRLTVAGVTRLGYGSCPDGQHDAEKVLIGDALRNAAMRFGVALELWIKGHGEDDERKTALAQRATSADEPADPAPLAEGEMLSRDAKGRVAAACGGDKELATQAWQAAGLHQPFENGRPRWKVTQAELDQAIAEAARLIEAATEGVAQEEQQEQPELPDVDNGKKAYDEASRGTQR